MVAFYLSGTLGRVRIYPFFSFINNARSPRRKSVVAALLRRDDLHRQSQLR